MSIRKRPNQIGFLGISAILLAVFFSQLIPSTTHANSGPTSRTTTPKVTIDIGETLALSATDVNIVITPHPAGPVFATGTSDISILTNAFGYILQMSAIDSTLEGDDSSISSIVSSQTGTEMLSDTSLASSWGYTKAAVSNVQGNSNDLSRSFSPIPTTTVTLSDLDRNNDSYTGSENIAIGYGVKAAPTLPYGTYTRTVTFTAVTTMPIRRSIFDITNMQDFALYPDTCANTPTPANTATEAITNLSGYELGQTGIDKVPTAVLVDTREDGINSYTVRKLADGNCWMTENLRLGSSLSAIRLTASDTDFNSDYRKANGMTLSAAQTSGNTAWGQNPYDRIDSQKHLFYNSNTMQDNSGVTQIIGGYYSWYTAVAYSGPHYDAGTGEPGEPALSDITTRTVFLDSICPKGWRLPGTSEDKSFNALLATYGIYNGNSAPIKFKSAPLHFIISGSYAYAGGVNKVGTEGIWWLNTSGGTTAKAYRLIAGDASMLSDGTGNRGNGCSVRCVAR